MREQSPGTPPERIAAVLNNMANSFRRMGNFAKAHELVDRALKLISSKDAALASACGTKAEIFLNAGNDEQAVIWIRKAISEREKHPSPNLESLAENLEGEIKALKRLGRKDELASAEDRLAAIRETMRSIRKIDGNLNATMPQMDGAVFVELSFGNRSAYQEGRRSRTYLANLLSEEVRTQEAGYYGGWAAGPENTTLFFYGTDAELLFKVIEPSLRQEALFAGSRVLIRQTAMHREVVIPHKSTTLNRLSWVSAAATTSPLTRSPRAN